MTGLSDSSIVTSQRLWPPCAPSPTVRRGEPSELDQPRLVFGADFAFAFRGRSPVRPYRSAARLFARLDPSPAEHHATRALLCFRALALLRPPGVTFKRPPTPSGPLTKSRFFSFAS